MARVPRIAPAAFLLSIVSVAALMLSGCGARKAAPPKAPPKPAAPPVVSDVDLKSYKPNEAGAIMVLMYHRIEATRPNNDMNRTPEQFRKDLQDLYDAGYRPVTVRDVAENRIDLPAGQSPVVITFDDSYLSQFKYGGALGGGDEIDPDCAVGIMEAFHQQHPDWSTNATFFILRGGKNPPAFYQRDSEEDKLAFLVKQGYEIGSHTANHANLRNASVGTIRSELAEAVRRIQEVVPDAAVTSLAIPYDRAPKSKEATDALVSGEEGGTQYRHSAIVRAAWRPTLATITKVGEKAPFQGEVAAGNPLRIERILPNPLQATSAGTFEFYMKWFQDNPRMRYVSDGNPKVCSVPKAFRSVVDPAKVAALGQTLQIYSLTGAVGTIAPKTP